MSETPSFGFGGGSVASDYDTLLVPVLFEPWAVALLDAQGPWEGRQVLDLAAGTGVVSRHLADHVGAEGRVIAADINAEMLAVARTRCADAPSAVTFVETAASPLDVKGGSVDTVICQQGFQFFPDRGAVMAELFRVLRPGGRFLATTWLPVEACEFFGAICASLEELGHQDISRKMRVPFDFMPDGELAAHAREAGFVEIEDRLEEADLVFPGGIAQALKTAWATPIGPDLGALDAETQASFNGLLTDRLAALAPDGTTVGRMASRLIAGSKPADE